MKGPFIFLCPEITREHALTLIRWMQNEEVRRYLSDSHRVSESIAQVLDRVNLPVLTHLFNNQGRFYMVCTKRDIPVGFIRLSAKGSETEMVIVIGDPDNWGKRLGAATIRESLKIAFFQLRSSKVTAKIHRENERSIRVFASAGFQLEHETPTIKSFAMTMEEYLNLIQEEPVMSDMIYITEVDKIRLMTMIDDVLYDGNRKDRSILDLEREINRAKVVGISQLPQDVITMNSEVLLHLNGEEMETRLVYPQEADLERKRLSVLSPIGTAILGYSEGAHIEWEVPSGVTSIQIKKILYQPEAAGHYDL